MMMHGFARWQRGGVWGDGRAVNFLRRASEASDGERRTNERRRRKAERANEGQTNGGRIGGD